MSGANRLGETRRLQPDRLLRSWRRSRTRWMQPRESRRMLRRRSTRSRGSRRSRLGCSGHLLVWPSRRCGFHDRGHTSPRHQTSRHRARVYRGDGGRIRDRRHSRRLRGLSGARRDRCDALVRHMDRFNRARVCREPIGSASTRARCRSLSRACGAVPDLLLEQELHVRTLLAPSTGRERRTGGRRIRSRFRLQSRTRRPDSTGDAAVQTRPWLCGAAGVCSKCQCRMVTGVPGTRLRAK